MLIPISEFLEKESGLLDLGFIPQKKWKDRQVIRYHRPSKNGFDILGIITYDHSTSINKNGFYIDFNNIITRVSFSIINKEFEAAKIELLLPHWYNNEEYNLDKILSQDHPNWKKPFINCPRTSNNLLTSNMKLNEENAIQACEILRNIIKIQVLPFYDLYPSLQSVNDEIFEKYEDIQELGNYIRGLIWFKKMVIMKKCKNPNYLEYIKEYEERLKKGVLQNRVKYLPYLDFYYRLKDSLENGN